MAAMDPEVRQAMQELRQLEQDKTIRIELIERQIAAKSRNVMRSKLTLEELSALPKDVPMYRTVGKCFMLQESTAILASIKSEADTDNSDVESLKKSKTVLEGSLKSSRENIQEMLRQKFEASQRQ